DRTAEAAAELVPAEGRFGPGRIVEELPRVESAVAHEFQRRSVERIDSRPSDGVDRSAAAAELRAVGIGQRLELGDRLDAERRAEDPGTGRPIPEIRGVLIAKQNGRSFLP